MCHDDCPFPISGGAHLHEQDLTLSSGDESLPVFVVEPERLPAPAVMIIHDIHGPNDFYHDVARRLADAGFIAALPDFFFRQGPVPAGDTQAARERGTRVDQAKTFGDIEATLLWLRDHEHGNGRIGTIGMCWGGSMVMLASSRNPTLQAAIPFYGFPVRERTPNFPILPIDEDEVAGVQAPMLGFWGDQDAGVGMDNLNAYDQKLDTYDKPHEFVVYPGLGHAFLTFDPTSDAFAQSQDAWQKTLTFLGANLGIESSAT
ncbi:MAG TPA: dienelactone hydrolase family protein [Thermomicrobiales bacterium]|nr:dienelactone hydrolase family protein [Thermomicrobiales bacterium]